MIILKINEIYTIKEIDYKTAIDIVIKNHYLHRKASCSQAFGLFEISTNRLVGVVIYGTPPSSTLRACCGKEHINDVIELTRLWIEDGTPKNVESFLVGNTLSRVKKQIIVSYADSGAGHKGIIYQATNFIYTGLSKAGFYYEVDGFDGHFNYTILDKLGSMEKVREVYGDKLKKVPRTRKHRYIFFNCPSNKRKYYLTKLKYKVLPYPK